MRWRGASRLCSHLIGRQVSALSGRRLSGGERTGSGPALRRTIAWEQPGAAAQEALLQPLQRGARRAASMSWRLRAATRRRPRQRRPRPRTPKPRSARCGRSWIPRTRATRPPAMHGRCVARRRAGMLRGLRGGALGAQAGSALPGCRAGGTAAELRARAPCGCLSYASVGVRPPAGRVLLPPRCRPRAAPAALRIRRSIWHYRSAVFVSGLADSRRACTPRTAWLTDARAAVSVRRVARPVPAVVPPLSRAARGAGRARAAGGAAGRGAARRGGGRAGRARRRRAAGGRARGGRGRRGPRARAAGAGLPARGAAVGRERAAAGAARRLVLGRPGCL